MKFFKPIFATLILLAAFWFIGWKDIAGSLEHIELGHVAFLVVLSMVMIWVSCVKWQLFIRAYGHEISIWRLMRLYIIGYFFNRNLYNSLYNIVLINLLFDNFFN